MNYGIVTEFNPFHNGHKYLVDTLKQSCNDTVTAVMSGNFVQRGEPACMSVGRRAEMALNSGVDLLLSLPVPYVVSSAEKFAFSGVFVLDALNCLDSIAFGSECNSEEKIERCAELLLSKEFNEKVSEIVNTGISFPSAREQAVLGLYGEELAEVLRTPNDILGVEYVKALLTLKSDMKFKTVRRTGAQHDSSEGTENVRSASMLRSALKDIASLERFIPENSFSVLKKTAEEGKLLDFEKFELSLLTKLRSMSSDDFRNVPDVSEGLEYRIYEAVRNSVSYKELLEKIKTKRYTLSRIRRILINSYLGITNNVVANNVPYIRVLGFNEKGAKLLREIKKNCSLPVITRSADIKNLCGEGERILKLESDSRDLYSLLLKNPDICGKELTDKIIIR
ncbi:MAG: nucleotidyltransferase family protein [Clostridia bacterium]|nr:nucleotidyltransferase family protein [Clostridia bacterium]